MNPDDGTANSQAEPNPSPKPAQDQAFSLSIPDQSTEAIPGTSVSPASPVRTMDSITKPSQVPESTSRAPEAKASPEPTRPVFKTNSSGNAKKRRMMIIVGLAVFVIAGGSAAAYRGYIVPNRPNNVIMKVLTKIADRKTPGGFAMNIDTSTDGESTPSTAIIINGSIDKDDNVRADLGITVSAFKLTASTIVRTNDKELYIKVNELPSLLKLLGSDASTALSSIADKLDKNWVKIDADSLKQAGLISEDQAKRGTSCIDAYLSYVHTQRSQANSLVSSIYKKHMFINASKAGKDTVDGVATTKYKLDIKRDVGKDFVNDLGSQVEKSNKAIEAACGGSSNSASQNDTTLDQTFSDTKIENVYMWVTGDKDLAKLSATVTDNASKVNLVLSFNHKLLDASKPANVITIKDLMQDYQNLLGGFDGGSIPPSEFLTL